MKYLLTVNGEQWLKTAMNYLKWFTLMRDSVAPLMVQFMIWNLNICCEHYSTFSTHPKFLTFFIICIGQYQSTGAGHYMTMAETVQYLQLQTMIGKPYVLTTDQATRVLISKPIFQNFDIYLWLVLVASFWLEYMYHLIVV
jgi:hypothetical protein